MGVGLRGSVCGAAWWVSPVGLGEECGGALGDDGVEVGEVWGEVVAVEAAHCADPFEECDAYVPFGLALCSGEADEGVEE